MFLNLIEIDLFVFSRNNYLNFRSFKKCFKKVGMLCMNWNQTFWINRINEVPDLGQPIMNTGRVIIN